MWNPIKNYKLKRDWRLVSTLQFTITWVEKDQTPTGRTDEVFYYLKENGLGERTCDHDGTGDIAGNVYGRRRQRETMDLYLQTIRPWLEGRYDPNIPTYESIKAKEFKDALSGKVT